MNNNGTKSLSNRHFLELKKGEYEMSNDFYSWLYGVEMPNRPVTDAMPADGDFKEEDHPRESEGQSGGGRFKTSNKTIEKEDDLGRQDTRIEREATPEELSSIGVGEEPSSGRFRPVEPSELSTMGQGSTNSKYRKIRNEIFDSIEKRRKEMIAAGKSSDDISAELDGSYSTEPPFEKVSISEGFQVSPQTTNGEGFNKGREGNFVSDEDYDAQVETLIRETGSKPVVGVFGGIPEISVSAKTKAQALEIAKRHNQVSICDNARVSQGIFDDLTFPKNKDYVWQNNQTYTMK